MSKVSIGLRGWRFDEEEVFNENGRIRPLSTIEPDARQRIVRLTSFMGEPCDACYLVYGDRKSTRLNSSHIQKSRMPSSA